MQATLCAVCKQVHRSDYRIYSEYLERYVNPNEFVQAISDVSTYKSNMMKRKD